MRPDLINLQKLDGKMFNIKYLIILRNTTDTIFSSLRRNFFPNTDIALRTVEQTLVYMEAALRRVPCHKIFIAHYEHVLGDPAAYVKPLSTFLELTESAQKVLAQRLSKGGKLPHRKVHKLTQYSDCNKANGVKLSEQACYKMLNDKFDNFFLDRNFMWPTFAGNGYNFIHKDSKN